MAKQYVINNEGGREEITDLDAAIKQAEMFAGWLDKEGATPFELNRLAYWADLRDKLLAIKAHNDGKAVQ